MNPTRLSILDRYNEIPDAEFWPIPSAIYGDEAALLNVAAVMLSGRSEEVETEDDVRSAIDHFCMLINSEIISRRQWAEEAQQVDFDLIAWGRQFDEQRHAIALSN